MANTTSVNNQFKNNLSVNTSTAARDIYCRVENLDNSDTASHATIEIKTGGASGGNPYLGISTTASSFTMGIDNADSDKFVISASATLGTTNTLEEDEYITNKPLQPAFRAYNNTLRSNVTGNNNLVGFICEVERFDQNSDYSTVTGIFTAPVTGKYFLSAMCSLIDQATMTSQWLEIYTTSKTYSTTIGRNASNDNSKQQTCIIAHMTAGDTAYPQVNAFGEASNRLDIPAGVNTNFSGILLN